MSAGVGLTTSRWGVMPAWPVPSPSQDVYLTPGRLVAWAYTVSSLGHGGNFFNGAVAAPGVCSSVFLRSLFHNLF